MHNLDKPAFLRIGQIVGNKGDKSAALIPISRAGWWQGVKEGRFPKPVKLGPRTTAWRAQDIRDLIERIEQGRG